MNYALRKNESEVVNNRSGNFCLYMQVFTCGDNSSFCCGHNDTNRPIFRPRLVEALNGIPCKQARIGPCYRN